MTDEARTPIPDQPDEHGIVHRQGDPFGHRTRPPQLSSEERERRRGGFSPIDRLDALHDEPITTDQVAQGDKVRITDPAKPGFKLEGEVTGTSEYDNGVNDGLWLDQGIFVSFGRIEGRRWRLERQQRPWVPQVGDVGKPVRAVRGGNRWLITVRSVQSWGIESDDGRYWHFGKYDFAPVTVHDGPCPLPSKEELAEVLKGEGFFGAARCSEHILTALEARANNRGTATPESVERQT